LIRLIGNQKNKKLKKNKPTGEPKTKKTKNKKPNKYTNRRPQTKKKKTIGDPKVKGQETDDCVFLVFWFFGFWRPQNQKPKKTKKQKK
jgi:carboxypeptidase C (cathepsin A)